MPQNGEIKKEYKDGKTLVTSGAEKDANGQIEFTVDVEPTSDGLTSSYSLIVTKDGRVLGTRGTAEIVDDMPKRASTCIADLGKADQAIVNEVRAMYERFNTDHKMNEAEARELKDYVQTKVDKMPLKGQGCGR